jgi:hypothetical protein
MDRCVTVSDPGNHSLHKRYHTPLFRAARDQKRSFIYHFRVGRV